MFHLFREGIKGDGGKFRKFVNINMFAADCSHSFIEEVCSVITCLAFFCHGFWPCPIFNFINIECNKTNVVIIFGVVGDKVLD